MNDLLVATFGFKLLLRDTGKLQRRTGGAGGSRLMPVLFKLLLLLFNSLRTGVFGREMEVLGGVCSAVLLVDEEADEFNSSWELSLDEEQLQMR